MQAAYHGNLAVLEELQKAGADVHATDKTGWTALMWAAAQGHVDILAWLLSVGAGQSVRWSGEPGCWKTFLTDFLRAA